MADSERIRHQVPAPDVVARELVGGTDDAEYCTVYQGSRAALIAAGAATAEQFPTGRTGDRTWTKSGGYAGSGRNPSQRWKVRRLRRRGDLFEVYRWHEPRPTRLGFERFMRLALQRGVI